MGYNLETRWTPSETQTPTSKEGVEGRIYKPLGIYKKGGGLGRRLAGFQLPLANPRHPFRQLYRKESINSLG